jgi:sugar/nucleoside kinase (ribokinase family)
MSQEWNLLVVGSVALDDIETPYGKRKRVLGGSAVYASCAARRFTQTAPVGVVGEDFPEEYFQFLESQGIDLIGLQRKSGKTFHWSGSYAGSMGKAETHDTQLGVFQDFSPDIPEELRSCRCVLLGNIHPALQIRVLEQMESPEVVGADTMNFWIEGEPELLRDLVQRVRVMFINEAEIRSFTGETNLIAAAAALLEMGPEIVVLKRGEHGMTIHRRGGDIVFVPAYPSTEVRDPTGAGDSLAGGFLGYLASRRRLSADVLREAAIQGTVAASCAIEDFGPFRLASVDDGEIESRVRTVNKMLGRGR